VVKPVIELQNVCLAFGGIPVLENISMTVDRGDYVAIIGPNGGGKSTLLKVMLGLQKADSGTIRVLDKGAGESGGHIGYLPQHTHVSTSFPITVLDAVRMGMVKPGFGGIAGLKRFSNKEDKAREALARVNMLDHENRRLAGLSGGQKQRVFIARALVDKPDLLFLDEPTASVDSTSRSTLFALLEELNKDMTILMVSHDISALASGVKSVACVNHNLHFHQAPEITNDMYQMSYGGPDDCCPVELITHGNVPHRVLEHHHGHDHDHIHDHEEDK